MKDALVHNIANKQRIINFLKETELFNKSNTIWALIAHVPEMPQNPRINKL